MTTTVGMIGLGHPHSRLHLRTLDTSREVERIVLYDPEPSLHGQTIEMSRKVDGVYNDVDSVLARPDVSVVVVTVPNSAAPAMIVRSATAGKHVLCEKPCGREACDLKPVLVALRQNDVRFAALYTWRSNPAILKMRELVGDGALGRLTSIELRMVTSQVALRDPNHWLFSHQAAGGGILSWLGCHWLDLLRYLTDQEVSRVAALVGTSCDERIDVEDVASVSMQLSGGALATLHAGYLLPSSAPGYEGARYDNAVILRGTLGTLSHSQEGGQHVVRLTSTGGPWATAPEQEYRYTLANVPAYAGAYGLHFVEDFLRLALMGEGTSPASELDALRVLQILDAIYASAREGRVVDVAGRNS